MFSFSAVPTIGKHSYEDVITLKVGSSLTLEVPYTASPEPNVQWTYNVKQKLPDSAKFPRVKIQTNQKSSSLQLTKVTRKDAGDYCLCIENNLGQAEFKVKVKVIGMRSLSMRKLCKCIIYKWFYFQTFREFL